MNLPDSCGTSVINMRSDTQTLPTEEMLDPTSPETNIIYANHSSISNDTEFILERLSKCGVLASGDPPNQIRFVINRHHSSSVVEEALARITEALK